MMAPEISGPDGVPPPVVVLSGTIVFFRLTEPRGPGPASKPPPLALKLSAILPAIVQKLKLAVMTVSLLVPKLLVMRTPPPPALRFPLMVVLVKLTVRMAVSRPLMVTPPPHPPQKLGVFPAMVLLVMSSTVVDALTPSMEMPLPIWLALFPCTVILSQTPVRFPLEPR